MEQCDFAYFEGKANTLKEKYRHNFVWLDFKQLKVGGSIWKVLCFPFQTLFYRALPIFFSAVHFIEYLNEIYLNHHIPWKRKTQV